MTEILGAVLFVVLVITVFLGRKAIQRAGWPSIVLLLALPLLPMGSSGCASLIPILSRVVAAATQAGQILDLIDATADAWFKSNPDAQTQKDYGRVMGTARLALSTALSTAEGAQKLDQERVDAAFADFRRAYQDLMALLSGLGIAQPAGAEAFMMVAPGVEPLTVPTPMALDLRVE